MKKSLKIFFLTVLVVFLFSPGVLFSADPATERKSGDRIELTINDVKHAFRWCPPGTFMMGSPEDEAGRDANETQHQVTLTRGFYMQETEVTQGMWKSVMGTVRGTFQGTERPVRAATWNECQGYVTKLNASGVAPTGFQFSLPTEAQWEYACRAGTTTTYSFGATINREQANFGGSADDRITGTTDVGFYPANAWGLRDMHGNVSEFCLDLFGDYPSSAVTDPMGVSEGSCYVTRGGSSGLHDRCVRSAHRGGLTPLLRCPEVGCRLVLITSEKETGLLMRSNERDALVVGR